VKTLMTLVFAVALAACGSKKDKEAPPPPPPPATGSGSAMTGSGSAAAMTGSAGSAAGNAAAVDVPTEMDFENQAKTTITDKNVDTEVKKIEQDLGSGQ